MNQFQRGQFMEVVGKWDINALFSKSGRSSIQYWDDIDDDGANELICTVGAEAHFVALDGDLNTVWENNFNTVKSSPASYSKIRQGVLYYGNRQNDTVYAVNLADGTTKWTSTAPNAVLALELMDVGLAVAGKNANGVTVLDYADGSELTGWPAADSKTPSQGLGAGDIDGDGQDELLYTDDVGDLVCRNRDGSEAFRKTTNIGHSDVLIIADFDGDESNELLMSADENGDTGGEGDQLIIRDASGAKVASSPELGGNPIFAAGDFYPDNTGIEIAYAIEGNGTVGLLNGDDLTKRWEQTWPGAQWLGSNPGGQIQLGDVTGDGHLDLVVNTDEDSSEGVFIVDREGQWQGIWLGNGWDLDPTPDEATGSPAGKQFKDRDGDGRAEISASILPGSDTTDDDIVSILRVSS